MIVGVVMVGVVVVIWFFSVEREIWVWKFELWEWYFS